ncbi:MAG: Bax inhibitor-1/YccA family protein [Deltaproteobacteria bacterium]|jgi:FtsH-binding integral membrane protein|nr:Bax inhibitor-1/YccA family protein [Deltaproteobacteria bacterium]
MQDFTSPSFNNDSQAIAKASEISFFQKVYLWMCGGLALSTVVSLILKDSQAWYSFLSSSSLSWLLILGLQIGLVVGIGALRGKVSPAVVKGLFLAYAASFGMTLSLVLMIYPSGVIFKALLCSSAVYGAMAVYGLATKKSLQAWGGFLFMGLIGLIVASVVNIFAKSPMIDFIICWIGVLVFAGLTAYDHQKLRVIHAGGFESSDDESKIVILGALELFLDFINLFMFFVRILGSRD